MNTLYDDGGPNRETLNRSRDLLPLKPEQAVAELTEYANAGSLRAMEYLAFAYLRGTGVEKNRSKAEGWFLRAADLGAGIAIRELGVMLYNDGRYDEARHQLERVVDYYPTAKFTLGIIYLYGHETEKNIYLARRLLTLSGKSGYVPAAAALGGAMIHGQYGVSNVIPGWIIWITSILRCAKYIFEKEDEGF